MNFEYTPGKFHSETTDEVEFITAGNPSAFVQYLTDTAFGDGTVQEYMDHFSKWNFEFDGITLRTTTPEDFVADLVENGYLKIDGNKYELHTQPNSV